jgi:preprotein translocase SecE subunit
MAGGIGQYLKDTRSELNHVAWPTRTQTIIYTVLVACISLGVAAYLGFFDYVFTSALAHIAGAGASASNGIQVTHQPVTPSTQTQPATTGPVFNVVPSTTPTPTK